MERTNKQKLKIEKDALALLARFAEIIRSADVEVEAVVVAAAAQAALSARYLLDEKSGEHETVVEFAILADVGEQLAVMVYEEAVLAAQQANNEVN